MADKRTNILEGEASESDEEVTDYPSFVKNTMLPEPSPPSTPVVEPSTLASSSGVVVSGEASESDEELSEGAGTRHFPSLQAQGIMDFELQVEGSKGGTDQGRRGRTLSKYQSPLHKKLREQNFSLRCGVVEMTLDKYECAHVRLQSSVPSLTRAQADVQETLLNIRKMAENFELAAHRLKIINETTCLPKIVFPDPV